MQQTDIYAELSTIFRDIFEDDTIVVTPLLTASAIPGWNSFNYISLIVAIESSFGIKFQTAELESLCVTGDLAQAVARKLAVQGR